MKRYGGVVSPDEELNILGSDTSSANYKLCLREIIF